MRIFVLIILFLTLGAVNVSAQKENYSIDRLKIFVDCNNSDCDETFFRSEITLVDFLLDNKAADVHILITEQDTGGGGDQFQLIFFGQNRFNNLRDTLRFSTDPNATDFEIRDQLIKYLKLGLTPYIAKTAAAKDVKIDLKSGSPSSGSEKAPNTTKDPWNYWVFTVGINGYVNGDAVYKTNSYSGNFSVNRTTEEYKIGINGNISKNKSGFEFEDATGIKKIVVKNHRYNIEHFLIKSISNHWSAGYSAELERSTFENLKHQLTVKAAFEYNIFPYSQVNTKFLALRGFLDLRRNVYFDSTLYNQTKETLPGYGAEAKISFNQKWGTTSMGAEYHNYFHDRKFYNMGINAEVDVRITGGLSFNIYTFGELVHDQLSLPKEGATEEEVLTRRRQLASGYNYYVSFGLRYRFGSKLNNFVNPRFD